MKTTRIFILRNSLFVFLVMLLALPGARVQAQSGNAGTSTQAASAASVSTPFKPVARITQAIDEAQLVPMRTAVHPLARAEFDRGVVADSQPMNRVMLVLQRSPEQEAALRELMDEQQTKNSPNYHTWLTPTTFGQQFGVADADIQKVTAWLAQKGFAGIKVTPGNMFIEFSGTAGAVRSAFHTEIHQFMVKGEAHMANVSVPQMPAALAPVVAGVRSLHNFRKKSFMRFVKPEAIAAVTKAAGSQFTFAQVCGSNGSQPCAAMAPGDFATIYHLPAGLDGTGQTIALVARSNIALSDINQFGTAFGISNLTNFTYANNVVLTGPDPGIMPGDDGEATLDIEWSGAVAPKATLKLVVSDSQATTLTDGVDLSAIYIVANNVAQILSESFGSCEAALNDQFESILWEQAASQGISVFVSTGDTGSAGCDPDLFANASDAGLQISGSASTPFNVAVGGLDFDDAASPSTYWNTTNSGTGLGSAKSYIPEITWNSSCASAATSSSLNNVCTSIDPNNPNSPDLSGGSGGASNCGIQNQNTGACVSGYPKPVWQRLSGLTGMPADSVRDIPDVSLFAAVNTASNHFYIICLADSGLQNGQPCNLTGPNLSFTGVGGTSASTPAFAGIIALVNQNEVNNMRLKAGEGQGNINYVLYKLAQAQYANTSLNCNSSTGPAAGCTFNDIIKGNNSVACVGSFSTPNGFGNLNNPNCSTQALNGLGVLVEPKATTTPAWTTTAGYDLATGLGSVNVSSLVTNWSTVTLNYQASTTTVTSTSPTPVTITHGANVTFNIAVASGSGTPTGDVTLVPQPGVPGASGTVNATLSSGTAQITTNQLPGGKYPVTVHYAGDGTFAASDSAPVNVTISKENSSATTSMWSYWGNPTQITSAPYGSLYLFRVDVIGSVAPDNQQCSTATVVIPCPTGPVTFTADGNPLNDFLNTATGVSTNVALLNPFGFVEDRILGSTGLKGGAHSIGASYAGDNSYNAIVAPAFAITIAPASTQTVVTANGSTTASVGLGQSVTLTANVITLTPLPGGNATASNGAGPTGTVTFSACGTAGSCAPIAVTPTAFTNANGGAFATATLTTTFTTAGTQNITATFTSGDTNYNSCTTPVNSATQLCIITPLNLTVTGTPGAFSLSSSALTLSSSTGTASGSTITVTPSGGFTGNVAVTTSNLPPGVTCSPSPLTINVTGPQAATGTLNCQVTASSSATMASNFGDSFRDNRGMLDAKAIPPATGENGGGKGWWALSAGIGFAALFFVFLPGGRKRLHAALGLGLICLLTLTLGCNGVGNSGGGGGGGSVATTTQMTVNATREPSGTAFMFNVTVTGGTPTGTAQLFDGATAISAAGASAAVSSGAATLTWNPGAAGVGTHPISVHYLGDSKTLASQSGSLNLTVTGATQVAITTQPAATPAASPITVTIQ